MPRKFNELVTKSNPISWCHPWLVPWSIYDYMRVAMRPDSGSQRPVSWCQTQLSPSPEWTRSALSFRGEQSKKHLMIYLSKKAKLILGEKWFQRKILIRLKQIRNQRREREYLWPITMRGSKTIIKWKITKIIWEMTDKMRKGQQLHSALRDQGARIWVFHMIYRILDQHHGFLTRIWIHFPRFWLYTDGVWVRAS